MKFKYHPIRNDDGVIVDYTEEFYVPDPGRVEPLQGELGYLPHLTVPDQTMSLRELLNRFGNAQAIPGDPRDPQYTEDNIIDVDFDHLDLAEQEEYMEEKAAEYREIEARYKENVAHAQREREAQDERRRSEEQAKRDQKQRSDPEDKH